MLQIFETSAVNSAGAHLRPLYSVDITIDISIDIIRYTRYVFYDLSKKLNHGRNSQHKNL